MNCSSIVNKELFKFSMVNSTLCDFCGHTSENICHLFWECEHTQACWVKLSNALEACNINVDNNFTSISLGILNIKQHTIPVTYIIVLAKYFIFKCKCQQEKPNLNHFKNYFKEKLISRNTQHTGKAKQKCIMYTGTNFKCLQLKLLYMFLLYIFFFYLWFLFFFIKFFSLL